MQNKLIDCEQKWWAVSLWFYSHVGGGMVELLSLFPETKVTLQPLNAKKGGRTRKSHLSGTCKKGRHGLSCFTKKHTKV